MEKHTTKDGKTIVDLNSSELQGNREIPEANLEAVLSSPKPDSLENNTDSASNILDSLLENVKDYTQKTFEVVTPSKRMVKIRPLTFEDEKKLSARLRENKDLNALDVLISETVEGDFSNLFFFDKIFILLKVREVSYGSKYKIEAVCKKCKELNKLIVETDKLSTTFVNDGFKGSTVVELPVAKKKVRTRVPKFWDDIDEDFNDLIHLFIVDVEGHSDTGIIRSFLKRLPARDVSRIRDAIFVDEYGIDTEINFYCNAPKCKAENLISLPFELNFFSES